MPANNVGHALDSAGNIQVDFVWGNFPGQPNDLRTTATDTVTSTTTTDPVTGGSKRLVPGKDSHDIILGGWNGYPGYLPNTLGEFTGSAYAYTPYIVVPNVLGLNGTASDVTVTIAGTSTVLGAYSAQDALRDSGYQNANIKVNGTNQTNTAITVTAASRTAGSTEVSITATGAVAQYPVGTKITITSVDATVNGTWTVTGNSSTNVVKFNGTATTVLALTGLSGSVVGVSGTVFSQTVAPAADTITGSADITVKLYA
jgi:hypothetical protein